MHEVLFHTCIICNTFCNMKTVTFKMRSFALFKLWHVPMIRLVTAFIQYLIFLCYLVMLHRGSMRCTVGSSMYSKVRLPGTLARSTLKLTCTGPAPVTDGAEKHTISDLVLLLRLPKERFIHAFDCDCPLSAAVADFTSLWAMRITVRGEDSL